MTFEPPENVANGEKPVAEFAALRRLLIGPEQRRLDELSEELDTRELTSEELAERLPEAIALRSSRDDQLGRALAPTIETALRESIRRDPHEIATAIFPVLGPAIRKAIAETMAALVRSINSAVEHSLSLQGIKWRIEAWRTGVPYPDIVIKHALVYRVEQVFLVHAETGLLLAHASAPGLSVPDADLISGMLTAIQDFVRDSFRPGEGATLRTFSVGDHTVQVEAGPQAVLAEVIRGQAPDTVLRRQQDTLETIHLQFSGQLADFSGDSSPFESARPLLEDCLETVVATTQARKAGRLVWLRWALPLLLVIVAAGALWVRAGVRWRHALAVLDAEPGIVVVNGSREWRSWRISGLRDPMAREPRVVLSEVGLAPHALAGRWEPYLSLDPAMVAARARKEEELDSLGRSLEGERILFDPGSAGLTPAAQDRVRSVAALFRQLDTGGARLGVSSRVELIGRTDPTGTDAANHALAQLRANAVASQLASSGVSQSHIVQNPVATALPLTAPDPKEQATINRSVSFRVTVTAGPQVSRER